MVLLLLAAPPSTITVLLLVAPFQGDGPGICLMLSPPVPPLREQVITPDSGDDINLLDSRKKKNYAPQEVSKWISVVGDLGTLRPFAVLQASMLVCASVLPPPPPRPRWRPCFLSLRSVICTTAYMCESKVCRARAKIKKLGNITNE